MLYIRLATESDFPRIDELFEQARAFMAANGNKTQWTNGFPNAELLRPAMQEDNAFVCVDGEEVVGVYCLATTEKAYDNLKGGQWQSNQPFVVIHRMATVSGKGVGTFIINHVMKDHPYVRIDTHADNKPMLGLLSKIGFKYCGTVFYDRVGGGERVALDYLRT